MKVLVTGGMGFIGSYVVRELLARGDEVVSIDTEVDTNQANLVLAPEEREQIVSCRGTVTDRAFLFRTVREHRIDRIVHLVHAADPTGTNPAYEVEANVGGFVGILEAARTFGLERVVWASSSAIFGARKWHPGAVGRDAAHHPRALYEAYKSHNEVVADHYARSFGLAPIGLRFNYVYGYGRRVAPDRPGFDQAFFTAPVRGEVGVVPLGDGVGMWQYVEDTAGTVLAALDAPAEVSGAFNTCGSEAAVREIAALVKKRLSDAEFEFLPGEMDLAHDIDDSETESALGYARRFDLAEGVGRTLELTMAAEGRAA